MKTVMVDLMKLPNDAEGPLAAMFPGFRVQGFVGAPGDPAAFVLDPDSPDRRERIATAVLAAQMAIDVRTQSWMVDVALEGADMLIAALDKAST
jgi:hypothetical protein